ncbi:MAG: histidinol-phosphate transaminase [Acidaminobacter sp.]|uniref:histidinol-phosphate transaminase n=1 Tax=Acidaminobacter sp. TaxID=1872102 RepID=UPI00138384EC|nr:histidinol-phosphate transaminase [Acidaminobacter sp.]MZQ98929.1 histidinol-phosphate transaminase [Acidaminobacter sp.]
MFRKCLEQLDPYKAGKPVAELKKELGLDQVYKLNANENPNGPSKEALKAVGNILEQINTYPDAGSDRLRLTLSELLGVKPSQIILGNGGDEIIRLVTEILIDPGDEAIAAVPYFSLYKNNVQLMNGILKEVHFKTFEFDPQAILTAITPKTRLIFLTSPNNPTGTIIRREKLIEVLNQVPDDIVILLDEAYSDYAFDCLDYPDGVAFLKSHENLIVLRTFSKSSGLAGMRVGYAVSSEKIINALFKIKLVFNVNLLAQAAALAALQDPGHVQKSVEQNKKSLAMLYDYFESNGFDYVPSFANFVFVNFGHPVLEVIQHLSHSGIFITPGTVWGYETWGRVSTGSNEAMAAFMTSMDQWIKKKAITSQDKFD